MVQGQWFGDSGSGTVVRGQWFRDSGSGTVVLIFYFLMWNNWLKFCAGLTEPDPISQWD